MTKMIRLPAGGEQEQSDLTAEESSLGEIPRVQPLCAEIRSLRENVSCSNSKRPEPSAKNDTLEEVQDIQNQRRTSFRLLTANRNDVVGTTSAPRSTNGQDMSNPRNSEQIMSTAKDPSNTSIICRLPLNRLESILGLLNNIKKSTGRSAALTDTDAASDEQDQTCDATATVLDNSQDALNDNNMAYKVLCLYCDRSFSNQKLMIKHTDRIHRIAKERRSSARVLSTAMNGSDVSTCCNFCHKSKPLNLISDDLQALFKHLITAHSDRYYACERCNVRFPNDEGREVHMETFHQSVTSGRPKSKAALKAFTHSQNNNSLRSQQTVTNIKTLKTGVSSGVKEALAEQMELSGSSLERMPVVSNLASSNMKAESVGQNICLRSSLRNATALVPEKVTDSTKSKTKAFKKSERLLRRNSGPMLLSRLGITQHRLPRQSRRLMAAASSSTNVTLLPTDTSSTSSTLSTSSSSSITAPPLGKFAAKKKGLGTTNEESLQNCYNKITKLKTIRSTLNTISVAVSDVMHTENTESSKALARGSDGTAHGSVSVINTGLSSDISSGLTYRGANSGAASNSSWCNTTASAGINSCNGNNAWQVNSSGMFDEDFYENVTRNVKNNLSCHLDGKLEASTPNAPCPMSPVAVVPTVRSTVVKSPVLTDSKIHEATNLPAITAMFPTLLTIEQYGMEPTPATSNAAITSISSTSSVKTKKPVTKNSWKWKWDFVKKYTYVNENGRIVKKIKQPTIGMRDLSKLDMWTQLTMRTKHELFQHPRSIDGQNRLQISENQAANGIDCPVAEVGAVLRDEKRAMVEQLDCILDARLLPQIDLEQNDQRIVKIEPLDENETIEETVCVGDQLPDDKDTKTVPSVASSSLVPWSNHRSSPSESIHFNFLQSLQLTQVNRNDLQTRVVLSGEWARPRCYICYGCGAKFNSLKQVEEHRIFRHPHVHSTFYEIVGRELIEKRLYKHFFVPFMALAMHRLHFMRLGNAERILNCSIIGSNPQQTADYRINNAVEIKNEDSSSNEATSFSTTTSGSSSSYRYSANSSVATLMDSCSDGMNALTNYNVLANDDEDDGTSARTAMCSKCQKECQNQIVLYAHILHCSNDYVWLQAKKRMKYRRAKRRRGGNRSGINCASSLLTIPRMVQPQQTAVEKVDSTTTDVPLSSSLDEKCSGRAGVVSSNISINSNDSYTSSSGSVSGNSPSSSNTSSCSISSNSSVNEKDVSISNGNQKNHKSPKRKENDSDIVKRLLANLPAKRNSRQINLQTTKQSSKQLNATEKKAFSSEPQSVTPKVKGQSAPEKSKAVVKRSCEVSGEPVAAQSTLLKPVAVPNGNSIVSIKKKSTSSISLLKREKVSLALAKLRSKQSLNALSPITNAKSVSTKQIQKRIRKKMNTQLERTFNAANRKKKSKESSNLVGHSEVVKGKKIKKVKSIGAIQKNNMLLWKKNQRQIIRVTTINGHHRILRSSGKRILPVSVCNRKPSLRSVRTPASSNNELCKKIMLKNRIRVSASSLKSRDEPLNEKKSTIMEEGQDLVNEVEVYENSTGQVACNNIDTLSTLNTLERDAPISQHKDADTKTEQSFTETIEQVSGVESVPCEESLIIPCSTKQLTPNQPIKKQYSKDPPSTPLKCNPSITLPQNSSPDSLLSFATAVEYNDTFNTKLGNQSNACKGKKKKLNDCIAMLTGKLSERLGVDFFNNERHSGEASQDKSNDSLSISDLKQPANPPLCTSINSSEEFLHNSKGEGSNLPITQNPSIHSALPVVLSNISKNASPVIPTSNDVLPKPTWSNNYSQVAISLPPQRLSNNPVDDVRSQSSVLPIPVAQEKSTLQTSVADEQISDEPLNLSKHGPVCTLSIKAPQPQQETAIPSHSSSQLLETNNSKNEKVLCYQNLNHSLDDSANMYPQNAHKLKSVSALMVDTGSTIASNAGGGNLSSLKLPPGLIIERVEYKQSRPIIAKEAPSVTIVARQRQVPAQPRILENSATDLTMEATTSVTQGSSSKFNHFAKPLRNHNSFVPYPSDSTHMKVIGYGKYADANVPPRRSELTTDHLIQTCSSSDSRTGPCGENRISVTITESKAPIHERMSDIPNPTQSIDLSINSEHDKVVSPFCLSSRKPFISSEMQPKNPQRATSSIALSSLHKTPIAATGHLSAPAEKISQPMTTLIIPQVPMPPLSNQAAQLTKRARRKSVFVPLPVPSVEPNRDIMAKPLNQLHPPAIPPTRGSGLSNANLLASMSLSFIAPGLLPVTATPMMGPFDMQRLASVRLPAHLQPPAIPPLKIPDAAASTALLEQMFQPTHSEVLSTGLELKKDAQCGLRKQSPVQPPHIRTNVYSNTSEESTSFIAFPTPKTSTFNGFAHQLDQVSKINTALNFRTEEIRPSDPVIKSNASSGMTSKGSGRIMKRRASVADLQRKALMEQIWNQSILDKMMHEKDTRIVSGIQDVQQAVETHNPPVGPVIEKSNNLRMSDERINHTIEQITPIPTAKPGYSSNSAKGSNAVKFVEENINDCPLENDVLPTAVIAVPTKNSQIISQQIVEEPHQHISSVTIPSREQDKNKEIAQMSENKLKDYNTQTENKEQEQHKSSMLTGGMLKGSTATGDQEERDVLNKEAEPAVLTPSIEVSDNIVPVDRIDIAQEDGSTNTVDCQVKASSTKIVRKRRKNELASILSDQLLESFKEVDKSRLDDLKLLHDLTCETPDVKFSLEQIPQLAKRKSNPRLPELLMQDTSKPVKDTSSGTVPKKVCNSKRLTKDKESTRLDISGKEENNKSSNETNITTAPNNMKSTQAKDGKAHSITNSCEKGKHSSIEVECSANWSVDENEKSKPNECDTLGRIEENSLTEPLAGRKATRSKTQLSFNNNQISHSPVPKVVTEVIDLNLHNLPTHQSVEVHSKKTTLKPSIEEMQKSNEKVHTSVSFIKDGLDTSFNSPNTAKVIENLPKRIMSRRKSIFVDCDLSQYVEKEEQKNKTKSSNSSIKDDIMLTSRPGTRSQGQLGLDLVQSFVEATMKPRDPRRRILQKRREEEFIAKENKRQQELMDALPGQTEAQKTSLDTQAKTTETNDSGKEEKMIQVTSGYGAVDVKVKPTDEKHTPFTTGIDTAAPLRRISARRASVCVRSTTSSKSNQEENNMVAPAPEVTSKEDEHMRVIGNEVKRIYKRRASIYQAPIELQEQDEAISGKQSTRKVRQLNSEENSLSLKKKEATLNKTGNRRSKTPGPSDFKRRNQLPLNGTPEPLIESLLLAPNMESNAPKRRTTKNSQIAETVSKLFNIQEEIMLIDSSRRKPRKVNPPTILSTESSIHEPHKETIESTNVKALENENEKCETSSSYNFSTVCGKVLQTETVSSSQLPRKSFSFSNDEDESPKAIKKMVENIINNTANSSNASTDYSDDDNMSLACFAARSNVPNTVQQQSTDSFAKPPKSADVYIPGRATSVIADDDSTTNTDALDDDTMSVTTEIPSSVNTSRMGNRGVRRKRRKSRRQSSKIKRQQVKLQEQTSNPVQSFNCELCRKVFKKQDAYNKHRMTLSHIAKLSEQEYLIAQQNQRIRQEYTSHLPDDNIQGNPKADQDMQGNQIVEEKHEFNQNLLEVSAVLSTGPADLPLSSTSESMIEKIKDHNEQPVKELSQEEKLFYECCSMLKESNSNENEKLKRVTMSLKSNEVIQSESPSIILRNDANNTSTPALSTNLPFMELNQRRLSSVTCGTRDEFQTTQVTDLQLEEAINQEKQEGLRDNALFIAQPYVVANEVGNVSPQSSIQSSSHSCTSGSNLTNGSNSNANNAKIKTKGALKGYDNFKVSIPMTGLTVMSANAANTCIGIGKESRLDTLADVALCGDIPKEFGIAKQSDEITSTPVEENVSACLEVRVRFPLVETTSLTDDKTRVSSLKLLETIKTDSNIETKINSAPTRIGSDGPSKTGASNKTGFAKHRESATKTQKKPSGRWTTGPHRRRLEKKYPPLNDEAADEGEDVYAFQDSPCHDDLPSTYSSKKNNTTIHNQNMGKNEECAKQNVKHNTSLDTASLEDHEDSQMSSLSFSDRDDFVYGTNTMSEEEEEEEDKNSSISSSEQTTPKKLTTADVQKKSLIMGRIFKKGGAKDKLIGDSAVRKSSKSVPETIVIESAQVAGTATNGSKSSTTVKSAAKDFDKLFDTLKNAAVPAIDLQNSNELGTELDDQHEGLVCKELFGASDSGTEIKLSEPDANSTDEQQEHEATNAGSDRLRRRRTVHQKNLTETWDSDEFEDFQTDDIMKIIDRTDDDEVIDNISSKKKISLSKGVEETVASQSSPNSDICNSERQQRKADQTLEKHGGLKRGGTQSVNDKKTSKSDIAVTDDTIRKVMESVILETMGKGCNISKRKPAAAMGTTTHTVLSNSKPLRLTTNNDNSDHSCLLPNDSAEDVSLALELTSLEEHTLESSVVISSKTITSKFKQKLNSSLRHDPEEIVPSISTVDTEKDLNSRKSNMKNESCSKAEALPDSNIKSLTVNNNNNNNNTNNNNNSNSKLTSKSLKTTKSKTKPKIAEEEWTVKAASMQSGKQRKAAPKKMKNIAYDPDSDYEQSIKCKKVKRKLLENDIEANLKIEQLQSTLLNADDNGILLTTSRRKRNAGDMLYYWSSSSDEESQTEEKVNVGRTKGQDEISKKNSERRRHCKPMNDNSPIGKKRGRKKKQPESTKSIEITDNGSDDARCTEKYEAVFKKKPVSLSIAEMCSLTPAKRSNSFTETPGSKTGVTRKKQQLAKVENEKSLLVQQAPTHVGEETSSTSNEQLQQHGWIMGDSHKKLVTMLAHAKGKHDSRKLTNNRKK